MDAQLALRHPEGPPDHRDLAPGTYTFLVLDDVSFFEARNRSSSRRPSTAGGRHTGLGSVALTVAAMCIVFSIWVGAAAFLGPLNKKCDALELEVVAEEEKHLRETQEMHAAMDLLQRTSFEAAGGGGGSDFRASDFAAEADAEGEAPSELVAHAVAGGVEERKWREEERHIAEEERRQEEEAHEAEVKALREEAEERQRGEG